MLKKILILGMILVGLLIASTFTVSAADETRTLVDIEDDVVDSDFSEGTETIVSSKPNVDITKLEYEQDGQTVTITLTVKGKIENRGSMQDALDPESLDADYVLYMIQFSSSMDEYSIAYVNNELNISHSDGYLDPTSWSAATNELKATFELQDQDDTFSSILAVTFDAKIFALVGNMYNDLIPDDEPISVSIIGPDEAKTNETISFTGRTDSEYSIYEWSWDFGDGESSNLKNPSHKFTSPDTYVVKLTAGDTNLNYDTESFTITIADVAADPIDDEDDSIQPLLIFIGLIAIIAIAGVVVLIRVVKNK